MIWEQIKPWCGIAFFAIWVVGMVSLIRFTWSVAPRKLDQWAAEHGYLLVRKKSPWPFVRHPFRDTTTTQIILQITVQDQTSHTRKGWVRLGRPGWPSLTMKSCPLEVVWDDGVIESKPKADKVLFQEL